MNEINQERGKALFVNKINSVQYTKTQQEKADVLKTIFQDKVGVMPIDNLYSSAKLANICLEVIKNDNITLDADKIKMNVLDIYYDDTKTIVKKAKNPLGREVSITDTINLDLIAQTEEAFNNEEKEVDPNNLISMISVDDLSLEGERARGYLPKDFNTLQDTHVKIDKDELLPAIYTKDEDGFTIMLCPQCMSSSIFEKGYCKFICLDCDTEFISTLSLEDRRISKDFNINEIIENNLQKRVNRKD